jgi:hypothetical protein
MENIYAADVKEIIKILKIHKKSDLVTKLQIHFEDLFDEDWTPPKRVTKCKYSDSEGSAEEEDFTYTTEDENGFLSLA